MEKVKAAQTLRQAAEKIGVADVLALCGSGVRIALPISRGMEARSIDELNLSVRAYNGLRRSGISIVGELADAACEPGKLRSFSNIGAKSVREIVGTLVTVCYNDLSAAEKTRFWTDFVQTNYPG